MTIPQIQLKSSEVSFEVLILKTFFVKHKWLLFALLGFVNAIPFTVEGAFFLSWVSFSPFFLLTVKLSDSGIGIKKLFLYILSFFFAFHFGVYHFFLALIPLDFIGIGFIPSLILMLVAWCFLSAVHAIMLSLACLAATKFKVSRYGRIVALAMVIIAVQYLQSLGTYGFTWARVSTPQSALLPLIQSASLFGPYFVDLLLLAVNALIAIAVLSGKYTLFGALAVAVFTVNFFYGYAYMQKDVLSTSSKTVSIVQGNVLTDSKWKSSSSYTTYMKETLLLENSDSLVVWSETAIPTDLNDSRKIISELEAYTLLGGNEMIVGGFFCSNVGRELNGAYYVDVGDFTDSVYFKRRLVPFGEFLPLRSILRHIPILSSINLMSTDLYPGYSTYVMETREGNVGCLICFDSIFPYLARESVSDGAELLVIMTNDSWYKDSTAVYQHNSQAKWRAVENGRYVVRAANSGISSFITPHGEIISSLPPLVKGTLTEEISFIDSSTVYTRWGDVIIFPILLYLLFCISVTLKKRLASAYTARHIHSV